MKKFDLEQAKAGKPVCTRDGRNVQIYDYNFAGYKIMGGEPRCNIAGKIIIDKEHEVIRIWEPNGNVYLSGLMDDSDLMMATEKHQGWVNIYKDTNDNYFANRIYETKEKAEKIGKPDYNYLITSKIEWEE